MKTILRILVWIVDGIWLLTVCASAVGQPMIPDYGKLPPRKTPAIFHAASLLRSSTRAAVVLPNTNILLTATLPLSWTFQSSPDLLTWTSFSTNPVPSLTLSVPAANPAGFFRVVTANRVTGVTVLTNQP